MNSIDEMRHLPSASTFCGRCESVCPMKIPLPKMMRYWRNKAHEARATPALERYGLAVWAFAAKQPWLYHLGARAVVRLLARLGRKHGGRRYRRTDRAARSRVVGVCSPGTGGRMAPPPTGRKTSLPARSRM